MKRIITTFGVLAIAVTALLSCMAFAYPNVSDTALVNNNENANDVAVTEKCYLVEASSGKVLYAKGENDRHEIASMVKIMTLLLTFEAVERGDVKLSDKVTVSSEAAAEKGSELFLDAGVQYTLGDLVKGITVVSANDASVAVAEYLAGDVHSFVDKMNKRANELGMDNTRFVNATGYPSEFEQYSTARDVNIMTRELIKFDEYHKYSGIWVEDFTHPSGRITGLANTNKLIRFYKGCDSGKTGFTNSAKFCLSASAVRNDMRVVGTVIGAESSDKRFGSMRKLFDYAFMNYKVDKVLKSGDKAEITVEVGNAKVNSFTPVVKNDLVFVKSRNSKDYSVEYEIGDIKAPMKKGDKVGVAKIIENGETVSSSDLILSEDLLKATYWDFVKKLCKR